MKVIVVPGSSNDLEKYAKAGVESIILGIRNYSPNYTEVFFKDICYFCINHPEIEVYIALNSTLFNEELDDVEELMMKLDKLDIKGLLYYDVGVLMIYKRHKFKYDLIWNQTHMVTNYNTCNYYYEEGVKYGILAGEVTKNEAMATAGRTKMKMFVTVVSEPIMAYTRRRLLTAYYTNIGKPFDGADKIIGDKDRKFIVKEGRNGTCILESDVVNGVCYLNELESSGIYGAIINGMNMDDELVLKLYPLVKEVANNQNEEALEEINKLLGCNTLFFDRKTVFMVKKDERKEETKE